MPKQNEELTLNDKVKFDNKGGSILGILEGPVADCVHSTRNGRLYTDELWNNVLKNPLVQEQFKNGGIVGELDHPIDRDDICTEKVAVIMPEPPIKKGDQYYGKFNILDTPCGRIVHTLAKAGFKFGVSSRGTGDVDDYTNEVDPSTYEFTCFDIVLLPAVESARMKLVTEGLETNKFDYKKILKEDIQKSSPESRKTMIETLDHMGIKLDEDVGKDKKTCVICGKEYDGYGNNAEPVKSGKCCDKCNQEVVIPTRLKKMGIKEEVEDTNLDEKPELPKEDILSSETLDDIELQAERDNECCCPDDEKLITFLHEFLEKEGLELDDEGKEEHFIELYHEIVCPKCSDTDEESVEDIDEVEVQKDEPEVEDNESSELLEQLQKLLKENCDLKDTVKNLQAEKAVSGTKVSKLNEELNTFKSVAASAGKKALELKNLETKTNDLVKENTSLKEDLSKITKKTELQETRISKLIESKENLNTKLSLLENDNKKLKESLEAVKTSSNKKLTEAKENIVKAKKLIEKYKGLAHDTANRYIERRALALGISKNEILNRLNESYSLDDVDNVCEDLQEYSLNISRLPFAFDKPGNARVRIREDHSKDPLKDIDNEYDDTVDDYLLDLAGLNKK